MTAATDGTPPVAQAATTASPKAGMRAYIDPQTGKLASPSKQRAAAAAEAASASSSAAAAVRTQSAPQIDDLPDGTKRLHWKHMMQLDGKLGPDGKVHEQEQVVPAPATSASGAAQ